MFAPPDDVEAIHALIQGAMSDGNGGFTVPCDMQESIAFVIGKISFAIDPSDIVAAGQLGNNVCVSAISSVGGPDDTTYIVSVCIYNSKYVERALITLFFEAWRYIHAQCLHIYGLSLTHSVVVQGQLMTSSRVSY